MPAKHDQYNKPNNIFIASVTMKGKDLFANIQEAREQITRLKK